MRLEFVIFVNFGASRVIPSELNLRNEIIVIFIHVLWHDYNIDVAPVLYVRALLVESCLDNSWNLSACLIESQVLCRSNPLKELALSYSHAR